MLPQLAGVPLQTLDLRAVLGQLRQQSVEAVTRRLGVAAGALHPRDAQQRLPPLEGRVEILAHIRENRLVCEVRDTGIGICPDDQQFIFDEFFQVDDSASSRFGGSGLGLALVRDLVVLLDGEIGVSSDAGRGTSMIFQIPVQVTG